MHQLAWEVPVTSFHLFPIGFTLLRLVHRWRTKKMWWDDYSAVMPLMVDIIYIVTTWLRFRDTATGIPKSGFIYSTWFAAATSWTVVWGSRLSISLSIARIFPEKHVCRRFAYGLAIIVSLIYAADLLLSALVCKSNNGPWYDLNVNHKNCLSRRGMPLRSVLVATAMDFIADILLIATPLTMLWKVKLPTKERRLILVLFSCNLFSLLSYTTFILMGYLVVNLGSSAPIYWSIFGLIQAAINLLICNVPVVMMFIYRILRRNCENDTHALPRQPPPPITLSQSTNNGNTNESRHIRTAHGKSSDHSSSLFTSGVTSLTTIYDSLSPIPSAAPPPTPSLQDTESKPASNIARESETGSSSPASIPPWSIPRMVVPSVSSKS